MAYTTIDKPSDYFNTKLYTGTGSSGAKAITGVGFQPDWLWIKNRTVAQEHWLADSIRGNTKFLESNSNNAESSDGATGLASFDSDGFTLGTGSDRTNDLNESMVAWNWLASNSTASNTDGSITSTVSANTTSGFSIVSFTGTGANATVGHGLGSAPRMMIFKNRDEGAEGWFVYHESIGNTKKLLLDETGAATTSSTFFQDTSPTSSIITLGSNHGCNGPDAMICYAFAEKQGYSKFGSYTGNGNADGSYIHLGFSASLIITKRTDGSDWWGMFDAKRLGHNGTYSPYPLFANTSDAEVTDSKLIDFTANGFKIKSSNGAINASGGSYIFAAFALNPFTTSTEIPTTAR